jgi:hypothetical protein
LGQDQHTFPLPRATRTPRPRPRICLRKGCERIYHPARWNQRYCQEPECLKLLRRWQAAKRQQGRRSRSEIRQEHAAAERARRQAIRDASTGPQHQSPAKAEGSRGSAWSRSKKNSCPFCDRPGCYEGLRPSCRCPARYCGDPCRQAVRQVCDRERKWFSRKTAAGRFKRRLEYQARRAAYLGGGTKNHHGIAGDGSRTVVNYRGFDQAALSCRDAKEAPANDRETPAGAGPRAPPAS